MPRKNPHAVALGRKGGRKGGLANTEAQRLARSKPKRGAGRPVKLCAKCGEAGRAHRWYRGEKHCPR